MWHRIDDPDNPPPKDGTRVLLYVQCVDMMHVAKWDDDWREWMVTPKAICRAPDYWTVPPPPPAEDTP